MMKYDLSVDAERRVWMDQWRARGALEFEATLRSTIMDGGEFDPRAARDLIVEYINVATEIVVDFDSILDPVLRVMIAEFAASLLRATAMVNVESASFLYDRSAGSEIQ